MVNCRNRQRCLHFRLLLEDLFEQLSGIVKNVDRHGKTALFLIMTDSYLRIIQAKTKAVHRRKSVNNATISYTFRQFALSVKFQFFDFDRAGDAVVRQVVLVCLARVPVKMVGIVN